MSTGMRGVLSDSELWVFAITTLIGRPMVVVVDDGHLMPYAQAFEWPDGSQGMAVRLAEDVDGNPTLIELTHVASGRRIEVTLPFSTYLSSNAATNKVFATVALMLADTTTWMTADCHNYTGDDGFFSTWKKLPSDTTLTDNGADVRTTAGGRLVLRQFVREPS